MQALVETRSRASELVKKILAHPLTRGLEIDDPRTTYLRKLIVRDKPYLRSIYSEWYERLIASLPIESGPVLEIGSGGGFLESILPNVITSDIVASPGLRILLDAQRLPLETGRLRAIVMTNVLHHMPEPRRFFSEAARCVRPGGALAMIEPWVTPWSSFIYSRLHDEPFMPTAENWEVPAGGPLSAANGAMPWMIFVRDRARFEREFREWMVESITPFMPFSYLLSGGVSLRSLVPAKAYRLFRRLDLAMQPVMEWWAMFANIKLLRVN